MKSAAQWTSCIEKSAVVRRSERTVAIIALPERLSGAGIVSLRQPKFDISPTAMIADLQISRMLAGDHVTDRKTQSRTGFGALARVECFERPVRNIGRESGAVVLDPERNAVLLAAAADRDDAVRRWC